MALVDKGEGTSKIRALLANGFDGNLDVGNGLSCHAADGGSDLLRREHIACDLDGLPKVGVRVVERADIIYGDQLRCHIRLDPSGERATRYAEGWANKYVHEHDWAENGRWQTEPLNILLNLPLIDIDIEVVLFEGSIQEVVEWIGSGIVDIGFVLHPAKGIVGITLLPRMMLPKKLEGVTALPLDPPRQLQIGLAVRSQKMASRNATLFVQRALTWMQEQVSPLPRAR